RWGSARRATACGPRDRRHRTRLRSRGRPRASPGTPPRRGRDPRDECGPARRPVAGWWRWPAARTWRRDVPRSAARPSADRPPTRRAAPLRERVRAAAGPSNRPSRGTAPQGVRLSRLPSIRQGDDPRQPEELAHAGPVNRSLRAQTRERVADDAGAHRPVEDVERVGRWIVRLVAMAHTRVPARSSATRAPYPGSRARAMVLADAGARRANVVRGTR